MREHLGIVFVWPLVGQSPIGAMRHDSTALVLHDPGEWHYVTLLFNGTIGQVTGYDIVEA